MSIRDENDENLLKRLRGMEPLKNPFHVYEYWERADLVVEHVSELPLMIRQAIARRVEQGLLNRQRSFFFLFKRYTTELLFGCPIRARGRANLQFASFFTDNPSLGWRGLDSDVDTEDQIELVIRLFPDVLKVSARLNRRAMNDLFDSVFFLASSVKAVSFIPLVVTLKAEFNSYADKDAERLSIDAVRLSVLLLNNTFAEIRFRTGPSMELEEKSLAALVRLSKSEIFRNYLSSDDVSKITKRFLFKVMIHVRSFGFIAKRLRFLIKWDADWFDAKLIHPKRPSLMKIFSEVKTKVSGTELDIRLYELALTMGRKYYPTEVLGIAFFVGNFEVACDTFGTERVKKVLNHKILEATESRSKKNNYGKFVDNIVQATVLRAARKKSIEELYTWIRFDPNFLVIGSERNENKSDAS